MQGEDYKEIIDFDYLHEMINKSGMTMVEISKKCEISRHSLYQKINGEREFRVYEWYRLCKVIGIGIEVLKI